MLNIDITLGLNTYMQLSLPGLFLKTNGYPCSVHKYISDDIKNIDFTNVPKDEIAMLYPDAIYWNSSFKSNTKTSYMDEDDDEPWDIVNNDAIGDGGGCSIILDKYNYIDLGDNAATLYTNKNKQESYELIDKILSLFNIMSNKEDLPKVKLVGFSNGEFYTVDSTIRSVNVDVNKYYNDDFKQPYKQLVDFLESKESGLALLHGSVGTGKSYIIRHLIKEYPRKYILITQAIAAHMGEPEFISFLISNKNSVFVIEDCEQILRERDSNLFGGAISNVLNMTDGLLSDIFNIKFICTFNSDFDKIDKALLRPGRCYMQYKFDILNKEKIKILADENNIKLSEIRDMSLAELFNQSQVTEENKSKSQQKKIGF